MGIAGLLPLLKPIQVKRHLSEYAGQTIAVDAYVWLHRGAYNCATEIVTGRLTNRYVDYAMTRVRLLRHYKIEPYIVFDGGPLPAKKRTESDRRKRREENLSRANTLAAQGKHTQAREYYVKCVDVTPQMAYQLIKALRAEAVPYVVAPYEADAQMAYLERIGLVDGILTEDSDLLVFGCKNVLFKLDSAESTVTSILRTDFADLGTTSSSTGGISLLGWSDSQFRAMAILSGCDYLASIAGIGLKTAWTLLKKHRTVENVIRALRMEGKKDVPKGYLEAFRLAEKVFLHQRVYDPTLESLVNLTDVPIGEVWDEVTEEHVGVSIEPTLAKKIAEGDCCPISLLPMDDINPTFVPGALKPLAMNSFPSSKSDPKGKGKGKAHIPEKTNSASILNFFSPKPRCELTPKSSSQPELTQTAKHRVLAGRASGKRTLVDVMDHDIAVKRKKRDEHEVSSTPAPHTSTSSRFFVTPSSSKTQIPIATRSLDSDDISSFAGPSRSQKDKENIPLGDEEEIAEFMVEDEPDPVTQEEGYISPASPSCSRWDTPELSSPVRPGASFAKRSNSVDDDDDFGADILSSPPIRSKPSSFGEARRTRVGSQCEPEGKVLVFGTPARSDHQPHVEGEFERGNPGPDLRDVFADWDDLTSEIDECADDSMESGQSTGPITPEDSLEHVEEIADAFDGHFLEDEEDIVTQAITAGRQKVAEGWWQKWSSGSGPTSIPSRPPKQGAPRRRDTTITAEGRRKAIQPISYTTHHQRPEGVQQDLRSNHRSTTAKSVRERQMPNQSAASVKRPGLYSLDSDGIEEFVPSVKEELAKFRYLAAV